MKSSYRLALLSGIVVVGILVTACSSQAATPLPTPTRIPGTPTATTLPTISPSAPVLGGSWQAFNDLFGGSNYSRTSNGWYYQGIFGPTWTATLEAGQTNVFQHNPNSRVTNIETEPPSGLWSRSQELTMVAQFLPPDAKLQRTKIFYQGNIATGTEETYTSVLLARTLPKTEFTDANGNQDQPGTFYVFLDSGWLGDEHNFIGTNEKLVIYLA
jgi:hypothetical protein